MAALSKRISNIEAALATLLQREKYLVLWYHNCETAEQAIAWHVAHKGLDEAKHDVVLISSNIPKTRRLADPTDSGLPEPPKRREVEEPPRFVPAFLEPAKFEEPRPEKPTQIVYPRVGIA
jgi:hypothetical protein